MSNVGSLVGSAAARDRSPPSQERDLEGVRSLGAVLGDEGFVWYGTGCVSNVGGFIGSTAARDRSPPSQERILKPLFPDKNDLTFGLH